MILAFGLADRTGDLMNFIAKNQPFQLFFMVIGFLVAAVGVIVAIAGWRGANNLLRLRLAAKKGATYDTVFQGTTRTHAEDFTKR